MVSAGGVAGAAGGATTPATTAVGAENTFSSVPSPSLIGRPDAKRQTIEIGGDAEAGADGRADGEPPMSWMMSVNTPLPAIRSTCHR